MGRFIAAFDVATACGCADGVAGAGKPRFWTWYLSDAGEGRPRRLAYLRRFCDAYFAEQKVDEVVYELPMGIGTIARMMAAGKFKTSDEVLMTLRGAIGVLECCAAHAGVPIVRGIEIKDARKHLLGRATFKDGKAKEMTIRGCRSLGWEVENDNEADAGALWSLAVGQSNPLYAAATRAALGDAPTPAAGSSRRRPAKPRDFFTI